MVFPLIPIVAGAGVGMFGSLLWGDSKKQSQQMGSTYAPQTTRTYSPTTSEITTYAQQYAHAPTINISSPFGSGADITKKDVITQDPQISPTTSVVPTVAPSQSAQSQSGLDLVPIAIIGALGLIGYALLK